MEPRAWTSEPPKAVDSLQERLGQQPYLDAVWPQEVVRVDHVAADQRWPQFAQEAAALGVESMLCIQLFVHGDRLGVGEPVLVHAGRVRRREPGDRPDLRQSRRRRPRRGRARDRAAGRDDQSDLIGQAKGILMERHRLPADQAFAVLVRVSREMNRELVEVARELAGTGPLPEERRGHRCWRWAPPGCIARFREETRQQRVVIADAVQGHWSPCPSMPFL